VKITETDGVVTAGQFLRADGAHLTILSREREVIFERTRVATVILEDHQGWRKAKRGFSVGALAGGLFGLFGTGSAPWAAMLASGWGSIGFLIGAVDGANEVHRAVIYQVTPRSGSR
jgi:hypothetical protein